MDQAAAKSWPIPYHDLCEALLQKAGGRVLRSDSKVEPSQHLPPAGKPVQVPGLANVRWRRSTDIFGTEPKDALYYDLFFDDFFS